jgi:hypothetical protein
MVRKTLYRSRDFGTLTRGDRSHGDRTRAASDSVARAAIYGKYNKFEIIKKTSIWSGPKFYIDKDGKYHRGSFSSLKDAVEAAKKDAG